MPEGTRTRQGWSPLKHGHMVGGGVEVNVLIKSLMLLALIH